MRSYRFEIELAQDGLGSLHFEVEVERVEGEPEVTGVSLITENVRVSIEIPLKDVRVLLGPALFDQITQQAMMNFQDDEFYDGRVAA